MTEILFTTTEAEQDLRTAGIWRSRDTLRVWAHRFPMQMPPKGRRERSVLYDQADVLRLCRAIEAERATYVELLLTVWDCLTLADHLPRHAALAA